MELSAIVVRAPTAVHAPRFESRTWAVGWIAGASESAGRLSAGASVDMRYYVNISFRDDGTMTARFRCANRCKWKISLVGQSLAEDATIRLELLQMEKLADGRRHIHVVHVPDP